MFIVSLAVTYLLYAAGAKSIVKGILWTSAMREFGGHALCIAAGGVLTCSFGLRPLLVLSDGLVPAGGAMYAAAAVALIACCFGEFLYFKVSQSAMSALEYSLVRTSDKQ